MRMVLRPLGVEKQINGLPHELYQGLDDDGDQVLAWIVYGNPVGEHDWSLDDRLTTVTPPTPPERFDAEVSYVP